MELHYKESGEGRPLIILHGLLGSSDNWATLAKQYAQDFKVYLVDQRNHGRSPHHDEFNYTVLAEDLANFINRKKIIQPSIIGHSMGGKVAMQYAALNPFLYDRIVVADISPRTYPVHHQKILDAMNEIGLDSLQTRQEAEERMKRYITEADTLQFLLKNLYRTDNSQFAWRPNLDAITRNIELIGQGLKYSDQIRKPFLFLRGERSNYIMEEDYPLIKHIFPNAQIQSLDAGHWLHAEKPSEFYKLTMDFLK